MRKTNAKQLTNNFKTKIAIIFSAIYCSKLGTDIREKI